MFTGLSIFSSIFLSIFPDIALLTEQINNKKNWLLQVDGFVYLFFTLEPPKDDGGADVTKYVVELSEGLGGELVILMIKKIQIENDYFVKIIKIYVHFIGYLGLSWELVYSGPAREHVCDGLKPGCSYQTRVYCMSEGGQSPVSHSASAHMNSLVFRCKNSKALMISYDFVAGSDDKTEPVFFF